jgi:hypothetical protein
LVKRKIACGGVVSSVDSKWLTVINFRLISVVGRALGGFG